MDESLGVFGLIAGCCRRGRQPFVIVLGDGTSSHLSSPDYPPDRLAQVHDRETRLAVKLLGLMGERLLMAGVYDEQIPTEGPGFDAVVRAVTLVMWARDCNVICAPSPHAESLPGDYAAHRIAEQVSADSGVGLLLWTPDIRFSTSVLAGWHLDITAELEAKQAAIAAHASKLGQLALDGPVQTFPDAASMAPYEVFLRRA